MLWHRRRLQQLWQSSFRNFGNPAQAGFGITIYGNTSGPSRVRGLRGRPPASLAADVHGDTGTAAAAKP
jgi:hypothetical protein